MIKFVLKHINRETISYLIVGGLTTLISIAVFAIATIFLGLGTTLANTLAHACGILFAYVANKVFVFRKPGWGPRVVFSEFSKFGTARALAYVLETALLLLLANVLGFPRIIMKAFITQPLVIVGNYIFSKWVVFAPDEE